MPVNDFPRAFAVVGRDGNIQPTSASVRSERPQTRQEWTRVDDAAPARLMPSSDFPEPPAPAHLRDSLATRSIDASSQPKIFSSEHVVNESENPRHGLHTFNLSSTLDTVSARTKYHVSLLCSSTPFLAITARAHFERRSYRCSVGHCLFHLRHPSSSAAWW